MNPNRNVLVTGAGGFIGSHLVEALAKRGDTVRAFVRYNSRQDSGWLAHLDNDLASSVEVVRGDLRDAQAVEEAMATVDTVFHLGAIVSIPYSYLHPDEVVSVNLMGTLNLLNAARKHGVERVVHTSTSEVYGTARYVPMDEGHPLQGQSPYAASKIGADKLVESFWRSFGLPVVTVRPFNTFGPRQSTRAVIPTIITQALASDRVVLGSLHPTRDFNFVDDIVGGFLRAMDAPQALGRVVNLGTGRQTSVGEVVRLVSSIVGRPLQAVTDPQRVRPEDSEVDRLCADSTLASQLLDWRPQTSLEDGLARTVQWVQEHLGHYELIGRYAI